MNTDYAPFLKADRDGRIWWRLEDAIKLGAGYVPNCDDERESACVLVAPSDRVRTDEETLTRAFHDGRLASPRPKVLERDEGRFVEARDFLDWLSQYIAQTQAGIPFPDDLMRALGDAARAALKSPSVPPSFKSLTVALEGWFNHPLSELPDAPRERVKKDFFPMPWDILAPEQRRTVAHQWDYHHDPAAERDRKYWWDFFVRKEEIERQIETWKGVDTPTASDLAKKESRLAELRNELARMEQHERQVEDNRHAKQKHLDGERDATCSRDSRNKKYIAYPRAMKLLTDRLAAIPEELAAWVWTGPDHGGVAAYLSANELDPPPRFYYLPAPPGGSGDHFDYVSPLMGCWFREDDITRFQPAGRYMTGKALIERWSAQPGIQPEAFIRAKIAESRLRDLHPICGVTQGSYPDDASWPLLANGLFMRAHVEAIEAEDFADDDVRNERLAKAGKHTKPETSNWKMLVQTEAAERWTALRKGGANPTKFSIKDDLARWCRENNVRTSTGINPDAAYIYRHALRDWTPPVE